MFSALLIMLGQGDAEYLRYHGMQEFDRAMQHLEETYGVSSVKRVHVLNYLGQRCAISVRL